MKTPAKAIKKVADKQKASASKEKNKSLIKVDSGLRRGDPEIYEIPIINLLSKEELRMARNLMKRNKGMDLQGAVYKLGFFK
jgi:hypothetical protein